MKILLLLLLVPAVIFAQDRVSPACELPESNPHLVIRDLRYVGLGKTSESSILGKIKTRAGQVWDRVLLYEDLERLRESAVFRRVSCTFLEETGAILITLIFEEKWTTIPIVKFSSGGGAEQYTLGLFDPNAFGTLNEYGGQFERLENTNSGVVWYRNGQIFEPDFALFVQAWSLNRQRVKYVQEQKRPEIRTAFLQSREKLQVDLMYRWNSKHKTAFSLEYNEDNFSRRSLQGEYLAMSLKNELPLHTIAGLTGLSHIFGSLKEQDGWIEGQEIKFTVKHAKILDQNRSPFVQSELWLRSYLNFSEQWTLAQQLKFGVSDASILQYWFYLGGLDAVRGFADNRFAGRNFWLLNSELRGRIFRNENSILSFVLFTDSVGVSEKFSQLGEVDGSSIGLGIRVILPNIYRFVVRFDYARPIVAKDDVALSFGVQQFF